MRITDLYIKNVRKHTSVVLQNLDDINNIFGGNGDGKSSIAESIVWGAYGLDLQGKEKQSQRLIRSGEKEMRVGMMIITDSGHKLAVERAYVNGKMELTLNGRTCQQNALEVHIGNFRTFMSAFLPGYFGNLEPREGRDTLMQILPRLSPKDVIATEMGEDDQRLLLELEDTEFLQLDKTMTSMRSDVKRLDGEIQKLNGKYEATSATSKKPLLQVPEPVNHAEMIAEMENKIVDIKAGSKRTAFAAEINNLQQEVNRMAGELSRIGAQKKPLPTTECPTCKQKLPDDENRTRLIDEVHQHNLTMAAQYNDIRQKGINLNKELEGKKAELAALPNDETQIKALQQEIQKLRDQERQTSNAIVQANTVNQAIVEARSSATKIAEEREVKQLQSQKLSNQLAALDRFRKVYADVQIQPLLKHLSRTTLKLYEVVAETAEMKPVFHIYWRNAEDLNVPYRSLSTSEKYRCDLEISRMISIVKGEKFPVFVDNAECMVNLPGEQIEGQLFAAYVDEHLPFTVESEQRTAA